MEDNEEQLLLVSLQELGLQQDGEGGEDLAAASEAEGELFSNLGEVEQIIGYNFRDQGLLRQAFTHGSYQDKCWASYERLEYVGDAVLNLLIAKDNYFSYPDLLPGKLTRLRAANVDTEKLARVAVKHNLHKFLRHNKPLLDGQIREFMDAIPEYPLHSNGLIDAPKVLADIVESTIGAIYIDGECSMDTTWKVVKSLLEPIITPETLQMHPVTKLYELCQRHGFRVRFVDFWKETGSVEVFVDDEFIERGIYSPKRLIAINRAANNAFNEMVSKLSSDQENHDDEDVHG